MTEAPVHIVPYDPSWIEKFEIEKGLIESLLEPWPWRRGPIEHVGSTAVVGLCAKPVIDIMVGVASLSESEPAKDILRRRADIITPSTEPTSCTGSASLLPRCARITCIEAKSPFIARVLRSG